jgi:hypothetical protein
VVNANCVVLQAAREIAIACEDLVTGTVTAVDASGVTVSYTLSDGTPVQVSQPTRRGGGGVTQHPTSMLLAVFTAVLLAFTAKVL